MSFFNKLALLASLGLSAFGATSILSVTKVSSGAQVVVRVQTTAAPGGCTVRASEGSSFVASVNDVNSAIFSGSNVDNRTGSAQVSSSPYVFDFVLGTVPTLNVAGQATFKGLDGQFHSRALQPTTLHFFGATCAPDAEVSTTFTTDNISLGNDGPLALPFDTTAFGNLAAPTIDWKNRGTTYLDPVTGIQLHRMTDAADQGIYVTVNIFAGGISSATAANPMVLTLNSALATGYAVGSLIATAGMQWSNACVGVNGTQTITAISGNVVTVSFNSSACGTYTGSSGTVSQEFNYGFSSNGHWTNPNNGTSMASGTLATCDTSASCTTSDALSLSAIIPTATTDFRPNGAWAPDLNFSDFLVKMWGSGTDASAANRTVAVCWTVDNQTCFTSSQNVVLPQTTAAFAGTAPQSWSVQTPWASVAGTTLTNIVVSSGTATVNFGAAHGLSAGGQFCVNGIRNQSVSSAQGGNGLNGCHTIAATPTGTSLTFAANAVNGTYTDSELLASPSFPTAMWQSWGTAPQHSQVGLRTGSVTVTAGAAVLAAYSGEVATFDTTWTSGTKLFIAGSSPTCTANFCTVSSMTDALHLTLVENLTVTGATWASANFGLLVKKTTGTGAVSVSAGFDNVISNGFSAGLDGSGDMCNSATVAISVDAAGNAASPTTGYLCVAGSPGENIGRGTAIYTFIPSTGETRLLGRDYQLSINTYGIWTGWDINNGNCWFTTNSGASVYHACYGGDYRALTIGYLQIPDEADVPEQITFTDIFAGAGNDMTSQIANCVANAKCPASGINASLFTVPPTPPQTGAAISGKYMLRCGGAIGGSQDGPGYMTLWDISTVPAQLAWANYSFTAFPVGYGGIHACFNFGNGQFNFASINGNDGQVQGTMRGPWQQVPTMYDGTGTGYTTNTAMQFTDGFDCPAGLDARWQALGAKPVASGGSPFCVKFKVPGDFCSANATVAESTAYPCPWNASSSFSLIKPISEGDTIADLALGHVPFGEKDLVVKVTRNSTTDIDLLLFRYGSQTTAPNSGFFCGTYGASEWDHLNGWTMIAMPYHACPGSNYWINALDNTFSYTAENPQMLGSHADFGPGQVGTYSYVEGAAFTQVGGVGQNVITYVSRSNEAMPGQLGQPPTSWPEGSPTFGSTQIPDVFLQSYPSKRQQNTGSASAPSSELNWALDVRHYNPGNGNPQETPEHLFGNTYTLVAAHTQTYLVTFPNTPDPKLVGFVGWSGYHALADASGPNSVATFGDSTSWRYCNAYANGECVAGSTAGQMYVSVPKAYVGDQCIVNTYAYDEPCIANYYPNGFWNSQYDTTGQHGVPTTSRRLTSALIAPGRQYNFANAKSSSDGKWIQILPQWLEGRRNDLFWAKLPAWPANTTNANTDLVTPGFPVTITGGVGKSARIKFGYDPTTMSCQSRNEACWTVAGATATAPYNWNSEAASRVACNPSCTINVPVNKAYPVYYQAFLFDGATETSAGPVTIGVLPNIVGCSITPSTVPNGTVGTVYPTTVFSNSGCSASVWSTSGTIPPGLTFNTSTGTLSGTPTTVGTYNFHVLYDTANNPFTVVISSGAVCSISPSSLPNGTVSIAYPTTTFTNSGCNASTWSTSGTLPTGLAFNTGTGVLSGTPTVAGTYNFNVLYDTASNPFTVTIASGGATSQPGAIIGSKAITGAKVIH